MNNGNDLKYFQALNKINRQAEIFKTCKIVNVLMAIIELLNFIR